MKLLQESIMGGYFVAWLALIILVIFAVGLLIFLFYSSMRNNPETENEKKLAAEGKPVKHGPNRVALWFLFTILITVLSLGNWLCNVTEG